MGCQLCSLCPKDMASGTGPPLKAPPEPAPPGELGQAPFKEPPVPFPVLLGLKCNTLSCVRKERPNFKPPPQLPPKPSQIPQIPARVLPNMAPQPPELSRRGLPLKAPPCKNPPATAGPALEKKAPPASVKGIQPASPAPPPGLNAAWALNLFSVASEVPPEPERSGAHWLSSHCSKGSAATTSGLCSSDGSSSQTTQRLLGE